MMKLIPFGISGYHSNAMMSSNPHSGVYVADTARTLDCISCSCPTCNQGGIAVVVIYETNNLCRDSVLPVDSR